MNFADASKLTEDEARQYLERIRWPNGPVCPKCGEEGNAVKLQGERHRAGLYQCRGCRGQFSVTVGTIMERSHITPRQWVMAFHLMCASKKGVSALQLQRMLGLGSYKSAWHMAHRIRLAMREEPVRSLLGNVEVDETYVGGKPRNRGSHNMKKRGRGTDKTPVLALIERDGRARAYRLDTVTAKNVGEAIFRDVDPSATLMTDELPTYKAIGKRFHDHQKGEYARGNAHVNCAESYFSLLKPGLHGSFHHVSKKHLNRYLDEFSFRWTHRKAKDGERSEAAIRAAEGKRLLYQEPAD